MTPAQLNTLRRLCNPECPPPLEPGEIEAIKAAVERYDRLNTLNDELTRCRRMVCALRDELETLGRRCE